MNSEVLPGRKTFISYAGNVVRSYAKIPARYAEPGEIPVISLITDKDELVNNIKHACTKIGFFYLADHGIPEEIRDQMLESARDFFALDDEEKQKILFSKSNHLRGYEPFSVNITDKDMKPDVNEQFNWGYTRELDPDYIEDSTSWTRTNPMSGENFWPNETNLKQSVTEYFGCILRLARRLARLFALALDLDENYFDRFLQTPGAMGRIIRYPSQKISETDSFGIAAHTDIECFTILMTDLVPALQILNPRNEWIIVPPQKDFFLINIGDMLARWTNDEFMSTVHRVSNITGLERYSVPCFIGVNYDTMLEPLPNCKTENTRYKPILAGEYVFQRLRHGRKLI